MDVVTGLRVPDGDPIVAAATTVWPAETIDLAPEPPGPQFGMLSALRQANLVEEAAADAGIPVQFLPDKQAGGGAFDAWENWNAVGHADKELWDWTRAPKARFEPFMIFAGDTCSPSLNIDYPARARALLTRNESRLIAAEFWNGAVARAAGWTTAGGAAAEHHYLADGNAHDVGPDVFGKPVVGGAEALGALEAYAGNVVPDSRLWIYAHPVVALAMLNGWGVRREGLRMLSNTRDSVLVVDAGFPLTGDLAAGVPTARGTGTQAWVYATATPRVKLSGVDTFGASRSAGVEFWSLFRVTDNTAAAFAERTAQVYFDPQCQLKVHVDYSKPVAV